MSLVGHRTYFKCLYAHQYIMTFQIQIVMIEFQLLLDRWCLFRRHSCIKGYGIDLEQSQHFTNNTWRHCERFVKKVLQLFI